MSQLKNSFNLILLGLLIFFMLGCYPVFNCHKWIQKEIVPKDYNGVVSDIIIVSGGGDALIILNHSDTIEACKFSRDKFVKEVSLGDTLIKAIGEAKIKLHHKGVVKVYEWPCCDW